MLVLPHADGLGVDFHQFRQRVGQSPGNAHSPAYGDVVVGELIAGGLRSTVNRRAVFADEEDVDARHSDFAHHLVRLASGGSRTDGHGLDAVSLHQMAQRHLCAGVFAAGFVWIDGLVVEQCALCIEAHHLASCAESRVDAHDAFLSQWSR